MSLMGFGRTQAYSYGSLDPSSRKFRLIRLLSTDESYFPGFSGTVHIEILEADLDSNIHYDALSYAWNVPRNVTRPNRRIVVETRDGPRQLLIFRPLEVALMHLAVSRPGRLLFVDQICINQQDSDEKSHQVQLMRNIYTLCAQVITWLGPATRESRLYFDYLHDICSEGVLGRVMGPRVGQFMKVFGAVTDLTREVTGTELEDRDDILDMLARYADNFPLKGLAEVQERMWFNRLWTIQEACLAPQLTFLCGDQEACLDCFRAGLLFYTFCNAHWLRNLNGPVSRAEVKLRGSLFESNLGFKRIFQERKAIHQTGQRQDLYTIILKYNVNGNEAKVGASLPEDRIFGLLGLAATHDEIGKRLKVQYKVVDRVYTEFAALVMERSMDALLFSQFPKLTRNLPSWVPDWSMNLKVPHGYTHLVTEPAFTAGGLRHGNGVRYEPDTRRLAVKGVLLDRVCRVGDRTLRADVEPQVTEQVDYRWAKRFFDEATLFIREASERTTGSDAANDEARHNTLLRLCDAGLTHRYLTNALGVPEGIQRLQNLHQNISHLGQRLIDTDNVVRSFHISRIIQTIGIVPWYWIPSAEFDILRLCATDPTTATKTFLKGVADAVTDMLSVCISSFTVTMYPYWMRLRKRFTGVDLRKRNQQELLERGGLDEDFLGSPDVSTFLENLLKNTGRKLYQTDKGYVGMGPAGTQVGDRVVVLLGGTVPHVLRMGESLGDEICDQEWSYVGEAYCDGFMHGKALETGQEAISTFTLI